MALTEDEIKQLAEIREQDYVQVFIDKKLFWLLVDKATCTLSTLMASSGTDTWEAFQKKRLTIVDKDGKPVQDDVAVNWKKRVPLRITTQRKKTRPWPQLTGLPAAFHKDDDA